MKNNEQTKAKIQINTGAYERTHGRSPKGFGNWLFCKTRFYGVNASNIRVSGTFSEASKVAIAKAKELGWVELIVCP